MKIKAAYYIGDEIEYIIGTKRLGYQLKDNHYKFIARLIKKNSFCHIEIMRLDDMNDRSIIVRSNKYGKHISIQTYNFSENDNNEKCFKHYGNYCIRSDTKQDLVFIIYQLCNSLIDNRDVQCLPYVIDDYDYNKSINFWVAAFAVRNGIMRQRNNADADISVAGDNDGT